MKLADHYRREQFGILAAGARDLFWFFLGCATFGDDRRLYVIALVFWLLRVFLIVRYDAKTERP